MPDYEWAGVSRRKPDLAPFRVERRPYDECPHCERVKYRPVYDGRHGESEGKCKSCKYTGETSAEPGDDVYVDHPDGAGEAFFIALLFAVGIALVVSLVVV